MHPDKWTSHFTQHVNAGLDGKSVNVSVGDTDLTCVIASTKKTREIGLSEHTQMPQDGMVFMYDADHSARYHNRTMSMAISIWFFDSEGALVGKGWNSDGTASADAPYRYVLETAPDVELVGQLKLNQLSTTR